MRSKVKAILSTWRTIALFGAGSFLLFNASSAQCGQISDWEQKNFANPPTDGAPRSSESHELDLPNPLRKDLNRNALPSTLPAIVEESPNDYGISSSEKK